MQKLLIFLRDVQLDWIDADPSIARSEGNQRLMTSMRWTSAYIVVTGYNRLSRQAERAASLELVY